MTAQATITLNNKIETSDAMRILGCSKTHLLRLVSQKKIKGQKIGKSYWLDSDDVYKQKEYFIPRKRKPKEDKEAIPAPGGFIPLRLEIDRERYELMSLALKKKNKTVLDFLNERMDDLYKKIEESLGTVSV